LDGVTAYVRASASATQVSVFLGDYKYSCWRSVPSLNIFRVPPFI